MPELPPPFDDRTGTRRAAAVVTFGIGCCALAMAVVVAVAVAASM